MYDSEVELDSVDMVALAPKPLTQRATCVVHERSQRDLETHPLVTRPFTSDESVFWMTSGQASGTLIPPTSWQHTVVLGNLRQDAGAVCWFVPYTHVGAAVQAPRLGQDDALRHMASLWSECSALAWTAALPSHGFYCVA